MKETKGIYMMMVEWKLAKNESSRVGLRKKHPRMVDIGRIQENTDQLSNTEDCRKICEMYFKELLGLYEDFPRWSTNKQINC